MFYFTLLISKVLLQNNIMTETTRMIQLFWTNPRRIEAVTRRCSVKKTFLEISQNSQENTCARVSFFVKKEALAKVFSYESVKILRTPFLIEHLRRLPLDVKERKYI